MPKRKPQRTSPKPHQPSVEAGVAPSLSLSDNNKWVTDGAWVTGLTGAAAIVLLAYYYHAEKILFNGFKAFGVSLTSTRLDAMLLAVVITTFSMIAVETFRLWRFYGSEFIRVSPHIHKGRYLKLFLESLKKYCYLLLLFWIAKWFYHNINEYGFRANSQYYAPWFYTLEALWRAFLILGLPYLLLTRAFKHDDKLDQKDLALTTEKSVMFLLSKIKLFRLSQIPFNASDRKVALGFAVKFFFCPVMTVFFFDNFGNLINNMDYLFIGLRDHISNGTYSWDLFGKDFGNIASAFIFTIDVGLAWVGYVVSSRWVDNQTISAEPTLLGWTVCLISYPPFRVIGGWFLVGPGEKLYLQLPSPFLVSLFGTMMVISYFIYMLPTIWFGVRFSNLTHRGIIRKGPFAIVRHPAYAAKNFGWWCVMFPVALYVGFTSSLSLGLAYVGGLIFMTGVYYLRAITEERHLSMDPKYVEYCNTVKYRFIPGVI